MGIALMFSCSARAADDVAVVRDRFVQSVLPRIPSEIQHIHDVAAQFAKTMRPDGGWPDIEYENKDRTVWGGAQHLSRIVVMAKSARLDRSAGHRDQQLEAQVLSALKFWTDHDYQNPNWWWNEIGVPELLGEISCLTFPDIPDPELAAIIKIMKRSVWTKSTGANLTWGVTIQITRGCLEQSVPTIAEAYARMYQEIRVVAQPDEGIQADWSFHQHGRQLYNGGYGLSFANDVGRFTSFAWGTSFQIPPEKMQILSSYILDGERWMTYSDIFDYSAIGREITRAGKVAVPKDWSNGSISPAGPAYSLGNVSQLLAALDTPRRQDFTQFESQLTGVGDAPPISGNRHFWCSDFMVHRRDGFMTSVKMFSTRMQNAENVNSEGRKSHHLADGANLIYVDGNEYRDIFPVWDWNKIPGTTAEVMADLIKDDPKGVGIAGTSASVGGASDGTNGLCAMELIRGKLKAKKSWFFFDHVYACLGAGITLDGDRDVITSINQSHLVGDVLVSASATPAQPGRHELKDARWIYHNRVGYVFPVQENVTLTNADQSGRWSDFGSGSNAMVKLPVFNLWIDHGAHCKDARYAYFVLPNVAATATTSWAQTPDIQILQNTSAIQAAFNRKSRTAQITFWSAGEVKSPLGNITVDEPCLLMVHDDGHGIAITASNPKNEPLDLTVHVDDKSLKLSLPSGLRAGASVTQPLPG